MFNFYKAYTDNSKELQTMLDNAENELVLPQATYYITNRLELTNKKNFVLDCNGSTFIIQYDNSADFTHSCNPFMLNNLENVTIKNMVLDTDLPTNISGTVTAVNKTENWFETHIDDVFQMQGNEQFMATDTVDEQGVFDYKMEFYSVHPDPNIITRIADEILLARTYSGAKTDYFGNNNFRVYTPENMVDTLEVGARICVRHSMYGNYAFLVRNCHNLTFQNITVYALSCMGMIVQPRCGDITIDGYKCVLRENAPQYMSANCDPIHVTGLTGTLTIKNSVFVGLGDDALNCHSLAGTITEKLSDSTIKVNYCKKSPDGKLSDIWCDTGDRIDIYDPDLNLKTGSFTVKSYQSGIITYDNFEGEMQCGYVLHNTAFSGRVLVDNCIFQNSRARALIIQNFYTEVKNCTFKGISLSAIKAAPSMKYWYEMGPVKELSIHHNRFENCTTTLAGKPFAVLEATASHDGDSENVQTLHGNITVTDNQFINCKKEITHFSGCKNVFTERNKQL